MSTSGQSPRKRPTKGKAARARRQARSTGQQPSQAEIKAMEARARATVAPPDLDEPVALDEEILVVAEPPPRSRRSGARGQTADRQRKRQVQPAVRQSLTKEQEYSYIRSDLRRLFYTAGPLLLLMLGLLFVIDG